MAGTPGKEGKSNPKYQMNRRRFTSAPGFHSYLPRVFAYKWRCSFESGETVIKALLEVGRTNFAFTTHPSTRDGHCHLWLTPDNAEYLTDTVEMIPRISLELNV